MTVSRRHFFRAAAIGGVAALGFGRAEAQADAPCSLGTPGEPFPSPIPNGTQLLPDSAERYRLYLPGPGVEPSSIFDLDGMVGVAHVNGTGTGDGVRYEFDVDLRFMRGVYLDMRSGRREHGTFGFL